MTDHRSWSRRPLPLFGGIDEVFLRCVPEPNSGCWLWTGAYHTEGYGYVSRKGRWWKLAHRWVYELLVGVIPEDKDLHHKCGNRACVNPEHLVPLSRLEHMLADGRLRDGKIYHASRQAA